LLAPLPFGSIGEKTVRTKSRFLIRLHIRGNGFRLELPRVFRLRNGRIEFGAALAAEDHGIFVFSPTITAGFHHMQRWG